VDFFVVYLHVANFDLELNLVKLEYRVYVRGSLNVLKYLAHQGRFFFLKPFDSIKESVA
jgi:hypothetical protein